ncbi:hypothetical protein [Paracoccus saliphilus]|uniref:Uncharacterized protein n=1 Tax=Paracoccus saliphilus TaxID=405559 RepID=A0AA45W777_9RHOB|nr:hypothetical protein [Paracoccus saliphilus]WCR03084.1 hypothetical protein JHX88_20250 [Paracoccus saliphilus]SIT07419.1 hypothetical protein SAMN05421772_1166 [Paracoccus saliphilus]
MARYTPPPQSKLAQVFDVLVLLILTIGALYIPLWLGLAGSDQVIQAVDNPTWEKLGQNAAMVEQWGKLGFADAEAAAPLITARFDYSFNILALIVVIIAVLGYYTIMLRLSEKEYREVIAEKFGEE